MEVVIVLGVLWVIYYVVWQGRRNSKAEDMSAGDQDVKPKAVAIPAVKDPIEGPPSDSISVLAISKDAQAGKPKAMAIPAFKNPIEGLPADLIAVRLRSMPSTASEGWTKMKKKEKNSRTPNAP